MEVTLAESELAAVVRALRYWCYRAEADDPAHELLAKLDGTCTHPRVSDDLRGRGCRVCGYSSRPPVIADAMPVLCCSSCEVRS